MGVEINESKERERDRERERGRERVGAGTVESRTGNGPEDS